MYKGFKKFRLIVLVKILKRHFFDGINIFTLSFISKNNTPQTLVIFDTLFCHFKKKILKTNKEKELKL